MLSLETGVMVKLTGHTPDRTNLQESSIRYALFDCVSVVRDQTLSELQTVSDLPVIC